MDVSFFCLSHILLGSHSFIGYYSWLAAYRDEDNQ